MLYWFDLFGIAVFAITATLQTRERPFDLYGVLVVALVTALGGGTIRDVILGRTPVFWVDNLLYIIIPIVFALLTYFIEGVYPLPRRTLLFADACGLSLYGVLGAQVALESGTNPIIAVMMGVITATAGGMVRDVLYDRIPFILQREIYATAALAGAAVYVLLRDWEGAAVIGILTTLSLRLLAIRRNWTLPIQTNVN
jgi:uncharacterized membrane protein YeiH